MMTKIFSKLALSALIVAPALLASAPAHAEVDPAWTCMMSFKGEAGGLQVVVGRFDIIAKGDLNCLSINGEEAHMPVKLVFNSRPIELRLAVGHYYLNGQSASISLLTRTPNDLLGGYYLSQAQGAIFAGAGIVTAVRAGVPDITLQLSMQFVRGWGVNLALDHMDIQIDQDRL